MTKDAQIRLTSRSVSIYRVVTMVIKPMEAKINRKKTIVKLFVHHLRSAIRKQWCAVHTFHEPKPTHKQKAIETQEEHAKRQRQWMWSGANITSKRKKCILDSIARNMKQNRVVDVNFIATTEYINLQMNERRRGTKMLEQISHNKKFVQ